uniref:Uncharacterized protein n=1 Tax=Rhizophora mucronata TaxID=61149 RepID=A0A2P2R4H6_RHIMU
MGRKCNKQGSNKQPCALIFHAATFKNLTLTSLASCNVISSFNVIHFMDYSLSILKQRLMDIQSTVVVVF